MADGKGMDKGAESEKIEPMDSRQKKLLAIGFGVYLLMVLAIVVVYLATDDEDARMMGMYTVSTALVFFTLIFAVYVYRGSASDEYRRRYGDKLTEEEKEDWDKKN
ncbi:MAG: hypothetical protein LKJ94_02300 [Candidatus Methanomethylophilus sp.]|jgi:uncharacterized membrane protein YqjE|nr:hypothetical protein [Methanomethylophilus sp.]MCI2093759.1 hypothetical protein [Methanomethylophilus sp.]